MHRCMLMVLIVIVTSSVMLGDGMNVPQINNLTTDVLGAHNGYGRGCVMCHAPHSGAGGNGVTTKDATSGNYALWGQDLTPLYGQALGFGDGGTYAVTLPSKVTSPHDANTIILYCLSCHDGNLAKVGMMKGTTVETLPIVGGNAPTLLGSDGTTAGNYANDHPVGAQAIVSCGGQYSWDCTGGNTTAITMNGPNSSIFVGTNYGFPVGKSFGTFGSVVTAVTCTTCHDQHSELVYSGTMAGQTGNWPTSFFIRGVYAPQTGGNSASQFCRQCHGGEANESHGQYHVGTN